MTHSPQYVGVIEFNMSLRPLTASEQTLVLRFVVVVVVVVVSDNRHSLIKFISESIATVVEKSQGGQRNTKKVPPRLQSYVTGEIDRLKSSS